MNKTEKRRRNGYRNSKSSSPKRKKNQRMVNQKTN